MGNKITLEPSNKILCPFIKQPFENCYCTSTSSLYTEATIHYCGGNYMQCQIYDKNIDSAGTQKI